MAAGVPPPPLNSPSGSYYWLEWYTNLTNFLNGTNIPWVNLNFTGSNIHDIQTRNHNSLVNVQGGNAGGDAAGTGNAYHMLGALFIGFVASAGTAIQLPPGWTVGGANPYTVTHNLGLAANKYVVTAASNGVSSTVNLIVLNSNNFVITLSAASNFSFMLTQGS